MSADDEIPRGLTLNSSVSGAGAATVTFPAISGIGWVLTSVQAQVLDQLGVSGGLLDPITVNGNEIGYGAVANGAPAYTEADFAWQGGMPFPPNTAVTIAHGNATFTETLIATAYPV